MRCNRAFGATHADSLVGAAAAPLAAAAGLPFLALAQLHRRWLWLLWLPLGFCWGLFVAGQHLASRLDPVYEGRDLTPDGWVHSITRKHGEFLELEFAVQDLDGRAPAAGILSLIRLSLPEALAKPRPWGTLALPSALAPAAGLHRSRRV